ncbi:MAG TPA: helix-turn-helix domain-containing protein [Candidatus Omnitrophota bacterium]|nr:helix-turn-helix domain-containing protein [Candidatus Omnitrophota bacterium]HNX81979.1 helix-turn-helix domain-containing protein [Candidatus Omnitrophota bacterium]
MADEKLLTIREVSQILSISEKEVIDCAEKGTIPAYKIAGVYLRFKRDEIDAFKRKLKPLDHRQAETNAAYSFKDKLSDFFYFNDFYILCAILIALILYIILQG